MVYVSNNNISPLTIGLNNITKPNLTLFNVGQTLNATIQSTQGNQVQLNIGNQTLIAHSKEPITNTGTVQVHVKQTQPSVVLSIVPNTKAQGSQQVQLTLQAAYRQFIPAQTNISQAFQQLSLLQSLPPSLLTPINQLLDQMLKSTGSLSGKELKNKLEQSGLFLESKLKNNDHTKVQNDLKAQLLSLKQQAESARVKNPTSQLLQLTGILNQAINRLTVQQLQLYENPLITPLELPFRSKKEVLKNSIEIRKNDQSAPPSWEVLLDTHLPQGMLTTKLTIQPKGDIHCYLWCETPLLEKLIKENLTTLTQQFTEHELAIKTLQIVPQKPSSTQKNTQIALIDIHI
ncbi:hypothetical protein MNBD_GAMMA03-1797 [hydrothermal vent metagenome]|uniref:Flagellar hook-length control protein-like C-terminal domain-containing protein n=1 Tax=hydrothermal vent metagenome TaxID=652676 RepID=A0A3B0W9M8_9ZZZZ